MIIKKIWRMFLAYFSKSWIVSNKDYALMPPLFEFDNYDNCMLYGDDALYCRILFILSPKNPNNVSHLWNIIEKVSSDKRNYKHNILQRGICVTSKCPHLLDIKSDLLNHTEKGVKLLEECYNSFYDEFDLKGSIPHIACQSNQKIPFDSYDFYFGVLVLSIILLVLFAWIYDLIFNPNFKDRNFSNRFFGKYICSFSLKQNWRRLLNVDIKDPDSKKLCCFQGIRVFHAVLVAFMHFVMFYLFSIQNPRAVESQSSRIFIDYLGQGLRYNALQTFFLMSAWLLTYQACRDYESGIKITFSYVISKISSRFFRLTPLLLIFVIFTTTWFPKIVDGPIWSTVIEELHQRCKHSWIYSVLNAANLVDVQKMCVGQVWSQSVDFQYHALLIIILWLTWYKTKYLFLSIIILLGYHLYVILSTGCPDFRFPLSGAGDNIGETTDITNSVRLYNCFTTNLGGFLVGIPFGFIFYKYRNQNLFTKQIYVVLWWIIILSTTFLCFTFPGILITYFENKPKYNCFYLLSSRIIYSFGVGLFIFGLTQGQGGFLKKVFEWPPIHILGRLTYGVYLNHTIIELLIMCLNRSPYFVNMFHTIFYGFGFTVVCFLIAIPTTLFFEMPFEELRIRVFKAPRLYKEISSAKIKVK